MDVLTPADVAGTNAETINRTAPVNAVPPSGPAALPRKVRENLESKATAVSLGNMIGVMMRSQAHRKLNLEAIMDRFLPPLAANQFVVAEIYKKDSGHSAPVALITWARVSDAVDARIEASDDTIVPVGREEWMSGENYWIVEAIGEARFLKPLVTKLKQGALKGKQIKCRRAHKDGSVTTELL